VEVEEKKTEKDSGVKFNPTPEVIQVAPTATILLPEESNTNDLEVEVM
jgi:hypothetical protein